MIEQNKIISISNNIFLTLPNQQSSWLRGRKRHIDDFISWIWCQQSAPYLDVTLSIKTQLFPQVGSWK